MGTVSQFRIMGGAIVLAIATSVFNGYTKPRISALLPAEQTAAVFQSATAIAALPPSAQFAVRSTFAHGFNLQMIVLCAFAAAQIPASLLMWKRKQITV
jgi:small neutral amino acid transporter SnatA (MarC family)